MVNTIHTIGRFCGNFKSISKSALSKTYQLTRKTVDEKSKKFGEINLDLAYSRNVVFQVDAVRLQVQPGAVDVFGERL